jgi:hypothetical protein
VNRIYEDIMQSTKHCLKKGGWEWEGLEKGSELVLSILYTCMELSQWYTHNINVCYFKIKTGFGTLAQWKSACLESLRAWVCPWHWNKTEIWDGRNGGSLKAESICSLHQHN